METLRFPGEAGYEMVIGENLLGDCARFLAGVKAPCGLMLVCDDIVAPLYADRVERSLQERGYRVSRFVFPAGESSKSLVTLGTLLEAMGRAGLTRSDGVLALGGGVTCDLAGFAAAVYARGTDLILMPTSLLAAVDAAVGGKTGVDLACGKNLAGCFWPPKLVLCDCGCFSTLPEAEFANGMAEIIKYGLAFDRELLAYLEREHREGLELPGLVRRCCELKMQCVAADQRDLGVRRLLNLGHTIGHGIELCSDYTIPHGSAVAAGMCMICRSAEALRLCERGTAERIEALCRRYSLPTETNFTPEALYRAAASDKKRRGDTLTLVIPETAGRVVLKDIPFGELRDWIRRGSAP